MEAYEEAVKEKYKFYSFVIDVIYMEKLFF
jgi:S-adenosylmethionine:tRNA-ribosyltransferase-isomerase (queuine synthetase)